MRGWMARAFLAEDIGDALADDGLRREAEEFGVAPVREAATQRTIALEDERGNVFRDHAQLLFALGEHGLFLPDLIGDRALPVGPRVQQDVEIAPDAGRHQKDDGAEQPVHAPGHGRDGGQPLQVFRQAHGDEQHARQEDRFPAGAPADHGSGDDEGRDDQHGGAAQPPAERHRQGDDRQHAVGEDAPPEPDAVAQVGQQRQDGDQRHQEGRGHAHDFPRGMEMNPGGEGEGAGRQEQQHDAQGRLPFDAVVAVLFHGDFVRVVVGAEMLRVHLLSCAGEACRAARRSRAEIATL